jgi:hypothetical protein
MYVDFTRILTQNVIFSTAKGWYNMASKEDDSADAFLVMKKRRTKMLKDDTTIEKDVRQPEQESVEEASSIDETREEIHEASTSKEDKHVLSDKPTKLSPVKRLR